MAIRRFEDLPKEMQLDEIRPYFDMIRKKRLTLFFKRFLELIVVIPCIILMLIPFLIIAVAIKIDSRGSVLFIQDRVGQYAKDFKIIKFRTMVTGANKLGSLTLKDDKRITKIGKFIRYTRLDEFIQFINVLKGDMNLVGARPELRCYVEHYTPEEMATFLLKPGMICKASIEYRDENDLMASAEDPEKMYLETILHDKMQHNIDYLKVLSIREDIKILLKTIACVFVK